MAGKKNGVRSLECRTCGHLSLGVRVGGQKNCTHCEGLQPHKDLGRAVVKDLRLLITAAAT
ncbi:MAG: hypothetical protein WC640_04045 [Candidatus Paceibacterota bacterium]